MANNPTNPIDPVIHQPTRLRIMATLAGVETLDFNEIKAALALTDGNLSTHLTHLEKAGYVEIAKTFQGKKPRTTASMTPAGRTAFNHYLALLQGIIENAQADVPEP